MSSVLSFIYSAVKHSDVFYMRRVLTGRGGRQQRPAASHAIEREKERERERR